jgi:trk system potassium uptake protein TrkA
MLREANHEVTLVEQRREQCAKLAEEVDATVVCGDGCEPYILDEARLSKADAAVAVTGHDEDNLVVCLLSKYEYEVPLTIARINNPRNAWLFTKRFGIDIPVSDTEMIAKLLQEEVTIGDLVTLLKMKKGDVALVELTLPEDGAAIGQEIRNLQLPPDSVLVTVIRDDQVLIPKGTTVLQADDEILAVTSVASESKLAERLIGK